MAVVMSGTAPNGAKWRIHDDMYVNNTPEQNEALRRRACEIAYGIIVRHAMEHPEGCSERSKEGGRKPD